jgi:hypothetical protein
MEISARFIKKVVACSLFEIGMAHMFLALHKTYKTVQNDGVLSLNASNYYLIFLCPGWHPFCT